MKSDTTPQQLMHLKKLIENIIKENFPLSPNVLEAGGGSKQRLVFPSQSTISVIDNSERQLSRCQYAHCRILGDLHTCVLKDKFYDVVVFWDVLEHLDIPLKAVERCYASLKPGGLLVIAGPLPRGAKSLVTRCSPHFLHVAFYRWVLQNSMAGKPGHAPFPALFRPGCAPEEIEAFVLSRGGKCLHLSLYASEHLNRIKKWRLVYLAYAVFAWLTGKLSLGMIDGSNTDFVAVYQRCY